MVLVVALACAAPARAAVVVPAGDLRAVIYGTGRIDFTDRAGRVIIGESGVTATRADGGRLGFRTAAGWRHATRLLSDTLVRERRVMVLATSDPGGRRIRAELRRDADGVVALEARVDGSSADVIGFGIGFGARGRERFLGFGERSNAVDQTGRTVENRVEEGPYVPADYPLVRASIPPWALRQSPDAAYFPMPWLLSTRGYGVLVDNLETSRFRLGSERPGTWSVEVDAPRLQLRVFAGPTPAGALRRLTGRTGRQPAAAAPFQWGPWFQTGHQNTNPREQDYVRILRDADAPVSVAETHMRYMPCGADAGQAAAERGRTAAFHAAGLASVTYLREAVCSDDTAVFSRGVAQRVFTRRADGSTYAYRAFVGGRTTDVAQIDFSTPRGDAFHASLLARAVANGYDGWMEDYGEYTPPDSVSADGMGGAQMHNLYPVLYHRSGYRFARAQRRPIVRYVRSGWTGVAPYAQIVWGGDPTTDWGFDGLQSSVREALSIGLSGISTWGSDIGGFFTVTGPKLTPELLARWIEFGAVSGVMRTKAEGIGTPLAERPQIWEPATLPIWRRYAKLRTQLYPYIVAADASYRRTGLPMMRHLLLGYPADARAAAREDEFLFGPDLLAAPVMAPGMRRRSLYLPAGAWVELWRAVGYEGRHGGLELGRASVVRGGRTVTARAGLDELPLFVRAGAVLGLLPADVDTLADYGTRRGLVKLRDRRNQIRLLAFPRGTSSSRFDSDGSVRSAEGHRTWRLDVAGNRTRTYTVDASLATLRSPFVPRSVSIGGRPVARSAWRYDPRTRTVHVVFRARAARLVLAA